MNLTSLRTVAQGVPPTLKQFRLRCFSSCDINLYHRELMCVAQCLAAAVAASSNKLEEFEYHHCDVSKIFYYDTFNCQDVCAVLCKALKQSTLLKTLTFPLDDVNGTVIERIFFVALNHCPTLRTFRTTFLMPYFYITIDMSVARLHYPAEVAAARMVTADRELEEEEEDPSQMVMMRYTSSCAPLNNLRNP